jgi:hypothetical protein
MAKKFRKDRKKDMEGYAFVGCLLICLALGMLYGRPDVGALGGVGTGFLAMLIVSMKA